jgi:predicted component of type VI protein secretion system
MGRRSRSAEGLLAALKYFLQYDHIRLALFQPTWSTIEKSIIGINQLCLSDNTFLGTKIYDEQRAIKIIIGPLSFEDTHAFLKNDEKKNKLFFLIKSYLKKYQIFSIVIETFLPENIELKLGQNEISLGFCSWLGLPDKQEYKFQVT